MRILLVASRYAPHAGGLETVVANLARSFRAAGHSVCVVCPRYPFRLPAREWIDGIAVIRLPFLVPVPEGFSLGEMRHLAAALLLLPLTLLRLATVIRRFRPDVVNLHYLGSPTFFLLALRAVRPLPLVISLHGGDVDGEPHKSRFKRGLFGRASDAAAALTACSEFLRQQAVQLKPGLDAKLRVIHNGVDLARFQTTPAYAHQRPYILGVGQLVPHKGFDLLIAAFGRIAAGFPGVDLLLAGDGPERGALETQLRAAGLTGRVRLLGKTSATTVAALMRACLLVAMPSRREPFGIVALEAMAAGRPVLATPVGGLPEFAATPANRLVAPDEAAWGEALAELVAATLDDPNLGRANLSAAAKLEWRTVSRAYLQLYEELVGADRPALAQQARK